jgi:hypothetical protein
MAMKWAANSCRSTKFFLKVDDDVLVNMYALLPFLRAYTQLVSNSIYGLPQLKSEVIRDPKRKVFLSKKAYPSDFFPPYCSGKQKKIPEFFSQKMILIPMLLYQGGAYLISPDMPQKLFIASMFTKLFLFEDVYIGSLIKNLSVKIISLEKHFCLNCYKPLTNEIEKTFFWFINFLTFEQFVVGMAKIEEKMKN